MKKIYSRGMTMFCVAFLMSASSMAQVDPQETVEKGQFLPYQPKERSYQSTAKDVNQLKSTSLISPTYTENFEGTLSGWVLEGEWQSGTPTAAGGPTGGFGGSAKCVGTNLGGNYSNGQDYRLITPLISLPSIAKPGDQVELHFYEWLLSESGYDFSQVEVSTDGGATWILLDKYSGKSGAWVPNLVLLTTYESQDVKLAFHFTSDGANTNLGWLIDDMTIQVNDAPALTTQLSINSQNFPFIYVNAKINLNDRGISSLQESDFCGIYENGVLQTDNYEITLPSTGGGKRLADFVFLVDNSGSFGSYQTAVRNNMLSFVNQLQSSGIDYALGLCRFGQSAYSGNPILEDAGQLTQDADYFKNTVWGRNIAYGGTEPAYYAITQSISGFSFRPGAQKILIILADENPNQGGSTKQEAIDAALASGTKVYSLTSYSSRALNDVSDATNASYYDLTDNFNDILNDISSDVSNTYLISYKSSNPTLDGITRNVELKVCPEGISESGYGSYNPGALPVITRSAATIALESNRQDENLPITIEAEITDLVTPFVQSATLFARSVGVTTYSAVSMVNTGGDTWQGVIPAHLVTQPGVEYYITATDGTGTSSSPTTNPAANPYQIAVWPNEAPVIVHTPLTVFTYGQLLSSTAEITDNTDEVSSVQVLWRPVGDLVFSPVAHSYAGGNTYNFEIQTNATLVNGFEYKIVAEDNYGVQKSTPVYIVLPRSIHGQNEWTGAVSVAWDDPANWSAGFVPSTGDDAIIPVVPNLPFIGPEIEADCKDLLIEAGAKVTIGSDEDNSGSLIVQGSASGTVCYQRYLTGGSSPEMWHLIGSPVLGQSINDFVVSQTNDIATKGICYGLAAYDNCKPGWKCYMTPNGDNPANAAGDFILGKGYEVLRSSTGLVEMCGTLSGDVSYPLTLCTNNWNLLSNPFTAALCANDNARIVDNLLAVNAAVLDPAYQAIYIWDPDLMGYTPITQASDASFVAPTQGFFVMAGVDGDFEMTQAMLEHETGDIFKSASLDINPRLQLFAEISGYKVKTEINYQEGTTVGLDPGYDAGVFTGVDMAFSVYSHLAGMVDHPVDFAVQSIPQEFATVIPIGLEAPVGSEITLSCVSQNLPSNLEVYLEDKLNGGFYNLSGSYSKTITIGEEDNALGRFYLHTQSSALSTEIAGENTIGIVAFPKLNYVQVSGIYNESATCSVCDLTGRIIKQQPLQENTLNQVDMQGVGNGVYIINVYDNGKQTSQKIMWNK